MNRTIEEYHRDLISGAERGAGAGILRAALLAAEPFYSSVVATRNGFYRKGIIRSQAAGRPVVSVGNITTGGTGKTPVVRWLAERFIAAGRHPAILLRGYKGGDEQRMLQAQLPQITVEADPSRVEAARRVLKAHPEIEVFLLDDGFQHRRLKRDFDLVLIDAGNPFGYEHVLPRGLLREPLRGLSRANAFLITHTEHGSSQTIEQTLRQYNPGAPIYRCRHMLTGLLDGAGNSMPLTGIRGRKVMTFCGIGNPAAFERQIASSGAEPVGRQWFGDHHHYTAQDLTDLAGRSRQLEAEMLITTAKDWIKLVRLVVEGINLPIWRAELSICFDGDDESRLLDQIVRAIEPLI